MYEASASEEFVNAIVDLDEKKAIEIAKKRLEIEDPAAILNDLKIAAKKLMKNTRKANSL